MKRKLTALLCALLIGCSAMAEAPAPAPTPEITEAVQSGGNLTATFGGETLNLDFDPDPLYSLCRDGYIQASFYAYGEGDLLYELYLTFPQNVQSGETISSESSLMQLDFFSGIYLYVSTTESETCSAATQYLTGAYPEGSGYAVTFSSVSANGTVTSFTGTVNAKLVELDISYNPTSKVNDFIADFSFSMDLGTDSAQPEPRLPDAGSEPELPKDAPENDVPKDNAPKNESPYPLPDVYNNPYPPAAPSHLTTPANAKKI